MKPVLVKIFSAACLALAIGACSSAPEPVYEEVRTETPPRPVREEAPRPVVRDEEAPPVQEFTGPTPGSLEEFRVRVGERIYFDTDRFNIDALDTETLDRQATWLQRYPNVSVIIAGNADERGTREYNLALGARRANSVKEYLVGQGVAARRIEVISYGKERPLDGRSNEEAWSINRNAQTQIVSGAIG